MRKNLRILTGLFNNNKVRYTTRMKFILFASCAAGNYQLLAIASDGANTTATIAYTSEATRLAVAARCTCTPGKQHGSITENSQNMGAKKPAGG